MRVAALYDIHANLPALEKILSDLRGNEVDRIVVGGDVIAGPMPQETLDLLLGLHLPVDFILGSVGSPYGDPSSHWLLLGPGIRQKQSDYDREEVGWRIRSTGYPQADGFANDVVNPPSAEEMTDVFEEWALRTSPA